MLSVAEVFELTPGDDLNATWINPGMTGVIWAIKQTKTRKNQPMFICTLKDGEGSAEISMTLFDHLSTSTGVALKEGDIIEIFGKGLRRSEYEGLQQISLGRTTEIHKTGSSAHYKPQDKAPAPQAGSEIRAPISTERQPQVDVIFGGTVGMAMKESLAIHTKLAGEALPGALCSPLFWGAVHETASDIIRISLHLEKGKLAPSCKERNRTPEEKAAEEKARIEAEEKAAAEKAEAERKEKEAADKAAKGSQETKKPDDDLPY